MNSPESRFASVYLLPGRTESIQPIHDVLSHAFTQVNLFQPCMPTTVRGETALDWARIKLYSYIKPGSLFVGVGLGGLLAAVIQRHWPALNLSVVALNAPVKEDSLIMGDSYLAPELLALYSSACEGISGRCWWSHFTQTSFDLPWLQHGVDGVRYAAGYLVAAHMRGLDISKEISAFPQAAAVAP